MSLFLLVVMADKTRAVKPLLSEQLRDAPSMPNVVMPRCTTMPPVRGLSATRMGAVPDFQLDRRGRIRSRKKCLAPSERGNRPTPNKEALPLPSVRVPSKEKSLAIAVRIEPTRGPVGTQINGSGRSTSKSRPPQHSNRASFEANGPANRSWAAIAKSATKGYDLTFVPPSIVDSKPLVHISEEILDATDPKWNECLVGYYVGKKLPFKMTEAALKHAWGHHLFEVLANDVGFFFFHIPDANFRRKILDGGPLTVGKVPLILQQWHPMLELKRGQHSSIPVWVRLRNIPLSLWSALGISAVLVLLVSHFMWIITRS